MRVESETPTALHPNPDFRITVSSSKLSTPNSQLSQLISPHASKPAHPGSHLRRPGGLPPARHFSDAGLPLPDVSAGQDPRGIRPGGERSVGALLSRWLDLRAADSAELSVSRSHPDQH